MAVQVLISPIGKFLQQFTIFLLEAQGPSARTGVTLPFPIAMQRSWTLDSITLSRRSSLRTSDELERDHLRI